MRRGSHHWLNRSKVENKYNDSNILRIIHTDSITCDTWNVSAKINQLMVTA